MKYRVLALASLALMCVSCTATLMRKEPWGEKVRISQRQLYAPSRDGELLAFDDSMLYYVERNRIVSQSWDQVSSVRVLAYGTNRTLRWICWVPTLVLGIVWFKDSQKGEAVEALAATAFTGMILYLTWPSSTFHSPPSAHDQERLRLYARYPQGLTGEQWQMLLHSNGQTGFAPKP